MEAARNAPETFRRRRPYRYLDLITALFVTVLLISNIVGQKIWRLGPLDMSAAQMLFPVSYIFGDVLTEVYGYSRSRRVIWIGFLSNALMALMGWVAVRLPPSPDWHNQEAFGTIIGFVPRLVIASLIAFWAGEFSNSYVLARMKILTSGRYLWARTIGSTVVGEAVDSVFVIGIAFAGALPAGTMVRIVLSMYLFKVAYEVVATPVTYALVNWLKREEAEDFYDYRTNFSPFARESPPRRD